MPATSPTLLSRAGELAAAQRYADAWRLLTSAEASADADALYVLAHWRLAGQIVRRDLAAARDYFRRAAAAGHPQAAQVHTAFVGNGTGGPADWAGAIALLEQYAGADPAAREQLELIRRMPLSPAGDPLDLPEPRQLSERPDARALPAFFTGAECDFLIAQALPALEPSRVVDPRTGQLVGHPVRTSDAMAFPFVSENPAIHALNRRIARATGTDIAQGEPLQVLRYRGDQRYRPHLDAIAGEANQRVLTVLVYLNDDYQGGETSFARTGLAFRGARGDALVFANALAGGRPDELAQHEGLPVTEGEKIIASRWIRARPFAIAPPPPLLEV